MSNTTQIYISATSFGLCSSIGGKVIEIHQTVDISAICKSIILRGGGKVSPLQAYVA